MRQLKNYIKEILLGLLEVIISLDRLTNTILFGSHKETISSRCGKKVRDHGRKYKVAYYLCRALHPLDKDHCIEAIENEDK